MSPRNMETRRETERKRKAARKAAGLCVRCGKNPPDAGKVQCPPCLVLQAKYSLASYGREGLRTRNKNRAAGLCACGAAVRPMAQTCQKCYDRHCRAASRKAVTGTKRGSGVKLRPVRNEDSIARPPEPKPLVCARCGGAHDWAACPRPRRAAGAPTPTAPVRAFPEGVA